jgi:hypothetical protein
MRKILLAVLTALAGCSRADVDTVGRIGQKLARQADPVFTSEPGKSMIRTLPLLRPTRGVPAASEPTATDSPASDGEAPKASPSRLALPESGHEKRETVD